MCESSLEQEDTIDVPGLGPARPEPAEEVSPRPLSLPTVAQFLTPKQVATELPPPEDKEGPFQFSADTVDGLFQETLELIRQHIANADRVVLLLQELNELSTKAIYGSKASSIVQRGEISRALIRRVKRTGRPLCISDALEDSGLAARGSIQQIGQRSVLCVPLKHEGKVVGFLYADSLCLVGAFEQSDLNWMNRLAMVLSRRLEVLLPAHLQDLEKKSQEPVPPAPKPKSKTQSVKEFGISLIRGARSYPGSYQPLKTRGELLRRRPSAMERTGFFRALAAMIAAGVPIDRALGVLAEQDSALAPVASSLEEDILAGRPLSGAFSRFPDIFSRVQVSLTAVGENSGTVDNVLDAIADAEERQLGLRGRVISALIYPSMVLLFIIGGCIAAPPLFLNEFFATLKDSGVTLPWLTRAVMVCSYLFSSPLFWLALAGAGFGVRVLFWRTRKRPDLLVRWESFLESVPVVCDLSTSYYQLQFVRGLALQVEAGLYLDRSLVLAARTSGSYLLERRSEEVVKHLKNGASLGFSLARAKACPRLVTEFLRMGEETGKLGESCRFVETLLQAKVEHAIETSEALVEPLSMALVGFLVGLVSLACMIPLVQMFEAFL